MVPFFYLARIFGVLPFSNIDTNHLTVTKCARLLSFLVQSFFGVIFLIYFINYYHQQPIAKEMRAMITSATVTINFILDQFNVWSIITLSQKLPRVVNGILRNFSFADKILEQSDTTWRKIRLLFFTAFTVTIIITKGTFLFITVDDNSFTVSASARYIYAMILVSEMLVSFLCLEIKSRVQILNKELKSSQVNFKEIKALHHVFQALNENHFSLSVCTRKFLLFDLSQMLTLVVFRALYLFVSCNGDQDNEGKRIILCIKDLVYMTDCIWRFCMLTRSCGTLQNEV